MKSKAAAYWTTTAILVFVLLSGGVMQMAQQRETVEGTVKLGYPPYFVAILGFWKVLAGVALIVPRFPRIKEWAYAGIFFEMTGAAASHAVCADYGVYAFHIIVPLLFAILALVSRALGPPSRRIARVEGAERPQIQTSRS